jgi:HEAT repeats
VFLHPNDDLLLNRYVDGETSETERKTIENRLRKDPSFRAKLVDLASLNATIDLGLGVVRDAVPETVEIEARAPRRARTMIAAASVLVLAVVAVSGWGLRRHLAAKATNPDAVIETLEGGVDRAALHADVAAIRDPATKLGARQAIYERWWKLSREALEPLVWLLAPFEPEPKGRRDLYQALPNVVRDVAALQQAARLEWARRATEPLTVLLTRLREHPNAETQQLFLEILEARPELPPRWVRESLGTIQATFPQDPGIGTRVAALLIDPDELLRAHAGLARAAIHQRDGIDCARSLLRSANPDVRRTAAMAIQRHGEDRDLEDLAPLAHDDDPGVRRIATTALEKQGVPIPPAPIPTHP